MNLLNLLAYFRERFPVINMALFAILFLTVYSVADFYNPGQDPSVLSLEVLWGIMAVISFFFRLRVFDEIKDYDLDVLNHPQRVLQSGRVSLRLLTKVSISGTILEILWSLYMGIPVFWCWLAAFGYSLLMRYEFFVGAYLKKRLLLYAFSHMLVMPLIILWVWSAFVPDMRMGSGFYLLAALSLLGGFSFELARKIHIKEAERSLVDSYSKSLGFPVAVLAVLLILLAGVATQLYLLSLMDAALWTYIMIVVLYLLTLFLYLYSFVKPGEKLLRTAEKFVSLFMLVSYLSIIIVVNF